MTLFAYKTVWMIAMRYYRHVIPSEAGRPARDFRFSISRDSLFHFVPFGMAVMWFRRVSEESLFLPIRFFLLYSRQNDKIVISTACERSHAFEHLGRRFFTTLTLRSEWQCVVTSFPPQRSYQERSPAGYRVFLPPASLAAGGCGTRSAQTVLALFPSSPSLPAAR